MKTIIAGSRNITDISVVMEAVRASGFQVSQVISGGARGVDSLGEQLAMQHGVPVTRMPADWDRFGKGAGYRRNVEMAKVAEALIAVWDGKSRGTQHMINIAREHGLRVYVHNLSEWGRSVSTG